MNMKKVVHFGAGNIGRGFFGELYFESGWFVTYADVFENLVRMLNEKKEYPLWIIGSETLKKNISNFDAVSLQDESRVVDVASGVDLISISVGANNLRKLAPVLSRVVERKFQRNPDAKLDIIIGENLKNAGVLLPGWIKETLKPELYLFLDGNVGFIETVLGRMVPVLPEELRRDMPLLLIVEEYNVLPLEKKPFRNPLPDVKGFKFVDDLNPYKDMKLYIHNFSHSGFAYLGKYKNYTYIWECVADETLRKIMKTAVGEVISALHKKYGITLDELNTYFDNLLERFSNRRLGDTVARVAREPVRKLGRNERIMGAADLCLANGIEPGAIVFLAAYAVRYYDAGDKESVTLKGYLEKNDMEKLLTGVCGLKKDEKLFFLVRDAVQSFRTPEEF